MFRVLLPFLLAATVSAQDIAMRQAAGTSQNPASAPMSMLHAMHGEWMLMLHGQAFVTRVTQSGPRGGDGQTFSTNWVMGSASRPLGGGTLLLRSMLSLEPATIRDRKYPLLFQTGETAFGKQLIDAQHPHDFVMELAAEYAHALGPATAYVYVAPVGDPVVGPVAFPHRASAAEMPQAPIGHHFEDSTHIAFNVITLGAIVGPVTIEGSAFHGGEPDEHRWTPDGGRIDSWAARIRLQPTRNLDLQVSHARLTKPERIEPGYATRSTASLSYSIPHWDSTIGWGRVYKEVHDRTLDAWLGETVLHLGRHYVTARAESVDKDELFPHPVLLKVPRPALPVRVFRVDAYTLGYTIDVVHGLGLGANVTTYHYPAILNGFYGERPHTVMVFLRGRLG